MTSSLVIESSSEGDTQQLGQRFAAALVPGMVVALNGQLGSGKTNLVRAVCQALGADENQVNSPTFVLMQTYFDGRIPVMHFDTYRLADVDEFLAIGGDEYLTDSEFVCFVEWAERISEVLPVDHLIVDIEQTGEMSRRFSFIATGIRSAEIVSALRNCCSRNS